MDHSHQTSITLALSRALKARKELLRSKNHWSVRAGLPQTTVRDAFSPEKNPTAETLIKMATAAEMTLAELLEYGDPDWETKAAARTLLKKMDREEIEALTMILRKRSAPDAF